MATSLTPQQMKEFVRAHFDEFVNKRNAPVIRKNMTPDSTITTALVENRPALKATSR